MRILLLEPDEYYHAKFSETLGPLGELTIATKTADVKKLLRESEADALIMELLLPDSAGYEFLQEIDDLRVARKLPVIIFSRVDHLEDMSQSLNQGVAGYFVKGRDMISDIKKLLLTLEPREGSL